MKTTQLKLVHPLAYVVRHLVDVLVARHKVTKPDGHQADETEIGPVQVVPALPAGKQNGAKKNVGHYDLVAVV
jgi:hypothetical protein